MLVVINGAVTVVVCEKVVVKVEMVVYEPDGDVVEPEPAAAASTEVAGPGELEDAGAVGNVVNVDVTVSMYGT